MRRKIFSSALCFFLSFLMVVYAVPSSAIAYAIEELTELLEAEETLTEESSEQSEEKELDALFELEEMRTADTKYVRMSDGTYKALVYDGAVHELDENGNYVEIDNSLTSSSSDYESGNARVKFAKKVTGNERIFKLKKGSYQIALALEYAQKGTMISVLNDGKEEIKAATKLEEISTISKIISSVSYKDILEGVDLEYVLTGETLKENIIVKEPAESYTYTFALSLNGLAARLTDKGDVLLENEDGEVVYTIPAPYMTDADGVYSEDVSYALSANGNGKYTLTVTASSAFMNAEERAFPVIIDPTIEETGNDNISDTYTDSNTPTSNYGQATTLYIGRYSGGEQFAYVMLDEFPQIPTGSMIANVRLWIDVLQNETDHDTILYAHKVYGSAIDGLDDQTTVSYSEDVYDYAEIYKGVNDLFTLDITRMYHEWANDSQYGRIVRLSLEGAASGEYITLASANHNDSYQLKPTFEITYINTIGTEGYFSYSTQSAGSAGSAAISDHGGQLTVSFTDAVSDNSALSVSIGHVYNSILANKNYDADGTSLFSAMKTGYGFMLTTQQSIRRKTVEGTEYAVYTDSDGTIHYMPGSYANGAYTEFSDTEGLGLTVIDPDSATFTSEHSAFANMGFGYGSSLILKDQEGNRMLFYNGLPAVFLDKNGNRVKYLYNTTSSSGTAWFPASSGSQLRKIVQQNALANGAYTADITVATLTYNSDNYLTSISSNGRTVTYTYSGYSLTSVSVSEYLNDDTTATTYTLAQYGYKNGVLTVLRDAERQYGIRYTYDTESKKYTAYYEFSGLIATHTVGGAYKITYEPGQTTYTYVGADDSGSSGSHTDDVSTVKVFDYYGRTISSYTKDYLGNVYSASAGAYTESDDFSKNKLANASSVGTMATNLILNPSFNGNNNTLCFDWTVSNPSVATKVTENARTGLNALRLAPSAGSVTVSQPFIADASASYCFSLYVNMKDVTAATDGIWLQVIQENNVVNSTVYNSNLENNSWKRINVSFDAIKNNEYQLQIVCSGITGSVLIDDAQLEKASVPGEYNLLSGQLSDNLRAGWIIGSNASAYSETSLPPAKDAFTIADQLSPNLGPQLFQTVSVNASGKGFTLSGWAKAKAVAPGEYRKFALVADIKYVGNLGSEEVYVPFNPSNTAWQYVSGTVIPSYAYEVESITVRFAYDGNPNTAHVAGISLVESDAVGYTYDHNGNVTATTKAGLEASTYTYSGTKLTAMANGSVEASVTYDNALNDRLPTTVTTSGITTEYTYDTAGNVIGTVMRPAGSTSTSLKITASSTFNSNKTKQTSSTDERGKTTYYTYNSDGSLKTTTFDGVDTKYLYTIKGRQSSVVIDNLANVSYNYIRGNLTSINVGVLSSTSTILTYSFTYDDFGRTKTVSAMNHILATYTYQDKTGWLLSVTYGNGFVIDYTYDIFGRTTKVQYNGAEQYSYVYDGNGNLYSFTDCENGVVYYYDYSSNGNLISEEQFTTGNTFLQGQYYTYNSYGDVATSTLKVAGQDPIKYVCTYGYEDEDYNRSKTNVTDWQASGSGYNILYFYDELNRPTTQHIMQTGSSGNPVTRSYSYLAGANGGTTALVSGVTYSGKSALSYTYEYDVHGNITAIYDSGMPAVTYVYDELNQLVRENNAMANKTWVYTYDERGNILSKKVYAYTTGTLGTVQQTIPYTYHDQWSTTGWGDMLLAYNGSANFTYDAIGNPLSYNNGSAYTFSWSNGRQLTSGTKGNTSFAYTYNADGLRTQKVVNGVVTDYYWAGSQLAMMVINPGTSSEKVLKFYYDASGTPFCFTLNGEKYFYITNLQGDVVQIVSANQNYTGWYRYDAWGKIFEENGNHSGIAEALSLNPLRYRGYIYDAETEFYYLQSRYYDPTVGRFINSDGQLGANQDILSYNLFAYCSNNPVRYADYEGENATDVLKAGWTIAAIISQLDSIAPGWADVVGLVVGVGATAIAGILIIPWDSIGRILRIGWYQVKSIAKSASTSLSIVKAVSKTKTKIRKEKKRYDYWIAVYVDYGDGRDTYIPTTPVSYSEAIAHVRGGGNVFADSKNNAHKLAQAVGGGAPAERDPAHGGLGYWPHYHATRGGKRIGGHIFYVS